MKDTSDGSGDRFNDYDNDYCWQIADLPRHPGPPLICKENW